MTAWTQGGFRFWMEYPMMGTVMFCVETLVQQS